MSASAAVKKATTAQEILSRVKKTSTSTEAKAETKTNTGEFANISANAFYSVMFSENLSPEEKQEAVAKLLTFEGTKEQNRERIKEFETFKEYLQAHRERMATEIIKLTDTETFSELKSVYEDLNNALIDFDEKMSPLTDIIDSIYQLRTSGQVYDAFKEIKADREREELNQRMADDLRSQIEQKKLEIENRNSQIRELSNKRSFFGFGGLKASAAQEIDALELQKQSELDSIANMDNKIAELQNQNATSNSELDVHKANLRELLDITSEEHKERQAALVNAALHFVSTSKERVGSVRNHLGKMNEQVENLYDANGQMTQVYAILNEGIKDAEIENTKKREKLLEPKDAENTIAKLQREQTKAEIEGHITMLNSSAADTITTYGDLTSQSIRIKTMKDANDQQIAKARNMYTQGVAGVADRLSVVLQAVSGAALGESSAMAQETLARMSENTNSVAQKESIRIAMGVGEQNSAIDKAIEDLKSYGEITRAATDITREGLSEMRDKLAQMEQIAKETREDINQSVAVAAEIGLGVKKPSGSTEKVVPLSNPFKI